MAGEIEVDIEGGAEIALGYGNGFEWSGEEEIFCGEGIRCGEGAEEDEEGGGGMEVLFVVAGELDEGVAVAAGEGKRREDRENPGPVKFYLFGGKT